MKIHSLVQLVLFVSVVLIAVLSWILFTTYHRNSEAAERARLTEEIVLAVFELNLLTTDNLLHRSERAQKQWSARHESLALLLDLARGQFNELEGRTLLATISNDHEQSRAIFANLITSYKTTGKEISRTKLGESRLTARLLVISQSMVSDASRLAKSVRSKASDVENTSVVLLAAIFASLAAIII